MVGLGPGGPDGLTGAARQALEGAEVVIGHRPYLEQAEPFLRPEQERLVSGMTRELARAEQALDLALAGRRVAVVSGGDPGVYAMAAVIFELAAREGLLLGEGPGRLTVEVIPGVPAVCAAAALLGAPLGHDFACVSLSDRLTPWEVIASRLTLAARAGFVIALYNPRSRGRSWQYPAALNLVEEHRDPATPVGVVSRAGRSGQRVTLTTLAQAATVEVDMATLVIIGNAQSFVHQGRLVTPRGYLAKYG